MTEDSVRKRCAMLVNMRLVFLAMVSTLGMFGQTPAPIRTGPGVGSPVPKFEAQDQHGRVRTLESISGPKGALLVFFRSADW